MHVLRHAHRFASVALALTLASTAGAQSIAIYGGAEAAGDNTSLLFLGGTISPRGLGWKPYAGLSAYALRFDAGTATIDRTAFVPRVGLINVMADQSVSFGVGYSFSDASSNRPFFVPGESGDGVVGSFGWNYWDAGNKTRQVLASYNFGTQFLWSRGQALWALKPAAPFQVGGEVALLGTSRSPSAWEAQVGPVIDYKVSNQFHLGGAVGLQFGVSGASGSDVYGRVEFLWLPTAK